MFSLLPAALRPRFRALLRLNRTDGSPRRHRRHRTRRGYGCHRAFGRRNRADRTHRAYRGNRTHRTHRTDRGNRTHRSNGTHRTDRTHRADRADRAYRTDRTHRAYRTDRTYRTHWADRTYRIHRAYGCNRGYGRDRRDRACRRNDDCGGGKRCGDDDGDGRRRGDDAQRVAGFSARGRNFAELNIFFERGRNSGRESSPFRQRKKGWLSGEKEGGSICKKRYFLENHYEQSKKKRERNTVQPDRIPPQIKGERKDRRRANGSESPEAEGKSREVPSFRKTGVRGRPGIKNPSLPEEERGNLQMLTRL